MAKKKTKKMPDGGKVVPIIVHDKNDPRLRAYQDSLNIYNIGEDRASTAKQYGKFNPGIKPIPYEQMDNVNKKLYDKVSYDKYINDWGGNRGDFAQFNRGINEEMFPQSVDIYSKPGMINFTKDFGARYKQPVQPVEYQLDKFINSAPAKVSEEEANKAFLLHHPVSPKPKPLQRTNIQSLPIQSQQLPINTQIAQLVDIPDTRQEYWSAQQGIGDNWQPAGFKKVGNYPLDYQMGGVLPQQQGQMSSRSNASTYSGNATKPTKRKVMNKIMPIKAPNGAVIDPLENHSLDGVAPQSIDNQSNDQPIDASWVPTPSMNDTRFNNPNATSDEPQKIMQTNKPGYIQTPGNKPKDRNVALKLSTNGLIAGTIAAISGAIPDQIQRDNQNHAPIMYNPLPYGDHTQAISKYGNHFADGGSIEEWNRTNPKQSILRPIADYQKEFTTTPLGRSKVDNYGSQIGNASMQPLSVTDKENWNAYHNWMATSNPLYGTDTLNHNNESGQQTSASSFKQYEYKHLDSQGNLIGYKAPSVIPMSQSEFNEWGVPQQQQQQWQSNDQGISIDVPQQSLPIVKKSQKANYHTDEDTNYDIHAQEGKSGIHIKPSHKGKFTAYKKAHHVTTEQALHSKSPAVRKMANFARNAKKWHHGEDGLDLDPQDTYENGGILMLGEGGIRQYGTNSQSDPMHVSEGPSHDDGGIPMLINGQNAEIQGGEGVQQYPDGATLVFGGMKIPNLGPETKGLAGRTFQSIAKGIGEQEEKNMKTLAVPANDTEGLNPANKFDSLELGSKMAKGVAFSMRSKALTAQKNHLRDIQDMMQQDAHITNTDPSKVHQIYAKYGATIKGDWGISSDNNTNLKKSKTIDPNTGLSSKSTRKDRLPIKYTQDPFDPSNSNLPATGPGNFLDNIAKGTTPDQTSVGQMPDENVAPWRANMSDAQAQSNINNKVASTVPQKQMRSLADENHLRASDFLSELSYLGRRPDQVVSQEYKPYLETPYQVSFQDRRNQNQSTFNATMKQLQGTGSAASLAILAGQKYDADNAINAEEFRTNQGIFNQITNQNANQINEANKFNTQLKDQQYVRQAQAKSNTDSQTAQALASISNKIAMNRYENMNIRMTEAKDGGYRWNPDTKKLEWEGGPASFNTNGSGQGNSQPQGKITKKWDGTQWQNDTMTVGKNGLNLKSKVKAITKFGNIFGMK